MKLAAAAALLLLPVPALAASPPSVGTLGRDLVLSQSVPGRVVAVASNVSIESAVAGDVIVWGGDVSFGPNGSIAGNLVVKNNVNAPVTTRTMNATKKSAARRKKRRCIAYDDRRRGGGNGSVSGHHGGRVS